MSATNIMPNYPSVGQPVNINSRSFSFQMTDSIDGACTSVQIRPKGKVLRTSL
jgi:hypothetical protein